MSFADGGKLFPVDLLAKAVINRSAHLTRAFRVLVEHRNFIAAAALLRLQIDSCLRFHAVWLVEDAHDFSMKVMQGEHVRRLRDRDGELMTDGYLAMKMNDKHPWILRVYKRTSGYIHLSESHIFNTFTPPSAEDRRQGFQTITVGFEDNFDDDSLYEEATEAFIETTKTLFHYLVGWVSTKERGRQKRAGEDET